MYMQPLEEMVKEIRTNQHEFDNHLNTLLNMHVTMKSYEELVEQQSDYIMQLKKDSRRKLIPLLKISDKILAGFLYSKIVGIEEWIDVELVVCNTVILSETSEHDIIEVLGTLVDNAVEACTKEHNKIFMSLDSLNGRLLFDIQNEVSNVTLGDVQKFFEKGYSTKSESKMSFPSMRGLGLYNAKIICQRHGGNITVSLDEQEGCQYISFHLEL